MTQSCHRSAIKTIKSGDMKNVQNLTWIVLIIQGVTVSSQSTTTTILLKSSVKSEPTATANTQSTANNGTLKIKLKGRKKVIIDCQAKESPKCTTWRFKNKNGEQYVNIQSDGRIFWYNDDELRCRIRKPVVDDPSLMALHRLQLIGWEYDWEHFFDNMEVACFTCEGTCNRQCSNRVSNNQSKLIKKYKLEIEETQTPIVLHTGCNMASCTQDSFVNLTYHLCSKREYCRVPLTGHHFHYCNKCTGYHKSAKSNHVGRWGPWSPYSPSACEPFSANCEETFLCRYRVCNNPYPLPDNYCIGDKKGQHYKLEVRACSNINDCELITTDNSMLVAAVLINFLVIACIVVTVGIACGGESDAEAEMMRRLKEKSHNTRKILPAH